MNDAIKDACLNLEYTAATSYQEKAIKDFIQGKDVLISLPTGGRKSLCSAALPGVFDFLKFALSSGNHLTESPSICVVLSPLTALMKDQVANFHVKGLKCTCIGEKQDETAVKAAVFAGETSKYI